MWPFAEHKQYKAVATDDEEQLSIVSTRNVRNHLSERRILLSLFAAAIFLTVIGAASVFTPESGRNTPDTSSSDSDKTAPPSAPSATGRPGQAVVRREWRTISHAEQQQYISAVRCLLEQPSKLNANSSRYADFPWIHSHVGYYTHHSAPFLPWHRYFLHIYETALREECGYGGALVYWDWTLDAYHLAESVVFDPKTGFGGDGEKDGSITIGRTGRCVTDGPFMDVIADFYDIKAQPHCLSRGFRKDDGTLGQIDGKLVTPESIEETLQLNTYEAFVAEMESKVHDAIPFGIGGDFETFTAPYDPLFFLHHTQLDRLWWLWQQRDPEKRFNEYGGHKQRHSMDMAQLSDEVRMQGIAVPVTVGEVMDTENHLLRYRY